MKKLVCILMAFCLFISGNALAESIVGTENDTEKSASMELTVNIGAYYEVKIPASQSIRYQTQSTTINVEAISLRPGTVLVVEPAQISGELVDSSIDKSIKYTVGGLDSNNQLVFREEISQMFSINITEDEWNNAYVGSYTGKITFNIFTK